MLTKNVHRIDRQLHNDRQLSFTLVIFLFLFLFSLHELIRQKLNVTIQKKEVEEALVQIRDENYPLFILPFFSIFPLEQSTISYKHWEVILILVAKSLRVKERVFYEKVGE